MCDGHQHTCRKGLFNPVAILYDFGLLLEMPAGTDVYSARLLLMYNAGICRILEASVLFPAYALNGRTFFIFQLFILYNFIKKFR